MKSFGVPGFSDIWMLFMSYLFSKLRAPVPKFSQLELDDALNSTEVSGRSLYQSGSICPGMGMQILEKMVPPWKTPCIIVQLMICQQTSKVCVHFFRKGMYPWEAMKKKMETSADELSLKAFSQKGGLWASNVNDASYNSFSRQVLVDVFTRKRLLWWCLGSYFIIPLCRGACYSCSYIDMPLFI